MTSSIPPEPYGSETNRHCNKTIVRREMLGSRQSQDCDQRIFMEIHQSDDWNSACSIGFYWPKRTELSPIFLINVALSQGKQCYLPRTHGRKMDFYRYNGIIELELAKNGIFEPQTREKAVPDLLIVPCVAASKCGFRIGYGYGCYDIYLEQNKVKSYVIAYKSQEIDNSLKEPWDQICDRVFFL